MSIGSTRDLTPHFVKLRYEAKRSASAVPTLGEDRATARLLGAALDGGAKSDLEMGVGPVSAYAPVWMRKSEKIHADMMALKGHIAKLKEAQGRAHLVKFGSENEAEAQVDALTREVRTGLKRIDTDIKSMDRMGGPGDEQIKQQVKKQLAKALYHLSNDFRAAQTRYLNNVEEAKGIAQGSTLGFIEGEATSMDMEVTDPGFTLEQIARRDANESLIHERDVAIQNIVETISELLSIMRDLGTLVADQGTILDRIDHNIQEASIKVAEGVDHLVQAETTQKTGRMFLCIVALAVLVVVMLIIVIIRHTI